MKTFAVVLMAMLVAMSLTVRSNAFVYFGTSVVVEEQFSAKDLNVIIIKGTMQKGDTVLLAKHQDYLRAMKDKYAITGNTCNQAEIVAFFGNKRISLEDAFALLNNYNIYEQNMERGLKSAFNQGKGFHYSIELLTTEKQNLQAFLKVCPEFETSVIQKDENIFLMGRVSSHSKAIAIQEKLVAAGLTNHVIVAYDGHKQVPVYLVARNN